MIEYENECVGCPPHMGCLGGACPHQNVPHYYCDFCHDEVDELYEVDGDDYCEYCLKKEFRKE